MELRFLGGAREIGRSALLIDNSLLIDYGMEGGNPPRYPASVEPDAVVVSHGHLDHAGLVPALLSGKRRPPVHWTPPTRDLARLLAKDTIKLQGGRYDCPFTHAELARFGEVSETHEYRKSFAVAGYEVTLFDAGHIPGSAHVLVDDGDTRLLYTGDFHTENQRLLSGTTARPEADVVVCESTYSDVTRENRRDIEKAFARSVKQTLHAGGTVVVPAFAVGRTQEAMLVCNTHNIDCYVDGMGVAVTERFKRTPEFLRDSEAFRKACGHARFVDASTRDGQRERIADQHAAIITTAGMLSGGPAMTYVPEISGNPQHKIAFTGHQVEGTPGRDLLETGSAEINGRRMRIAAQVEHHDFSAHADRNGLLEFLDSYRHSTVLVNHGDRCQAFATELQEVGFDASAPENGATLSVGVDT